MLKYNRLIIVLIAGLSWGCKVNVTPVKTDRFRLPESYGGLSGEGPASLPDARSFFGDDKLTALIDTALHNNFDLQTALQKIELARAGVRYMKGINLPDLSASLVLGQRKFGKYTIDGVGNYDTGFSDNISDKQQIPGPVVPDYFVGLQSSWEADLWGKLKSKQKAAAARFIATEFGRDLIRTTLVAEVAGAYFELTILDNERNILEENIQLQQSALDIVTVLKQAGDANQLGVELLSAQLLSSRALKVEVNQKIVETENTINFLLGRFPQPIDRTVLSRDQILPPQMKAGVPSALLANRPDIRQAEMELMATNADVFSAKAAFYPSLNINAAMGFQAFKAVLLFEPASFAYTLAGGLTAPLLNRRAIIANLMASEAEQKQAYINYQKTVVNSFTEVYNYLNLIDNTNQMYDLKAEEVNILRNSIETSSELFKSGRATYLEVITAQKNALQSQIELINLKKKQFNAVIGLYRSLGGGWNKAL
jgi:multidrug efflux system outer membrane protein